MRAKERGHKFTLTFEEYEAMAIATGYDKLKGKTAESLSINRIDNSRGYERDNVNIITLSENARKIRRMEYVPFFGEKVHLP